MLLGTDKFFNFFLFFSKFKFKFVSESVRNHWENFRIPAIGNDCFFILIGY